MKSILITIFALFVSLSLHAQSEEFVGIFKGVNENDEFVFQLESGKVMILQDMDYDIDIDLFDKDFIGKKIKVTWEFDSDDEDDDESAEIKKITALEEL